MSLIRGQAVEQLPVEAHADVDDFDDMRPILADDLAAFVRDEDRHRSLTVVREAGDRDKAGEVARWLDELRADNAGQQPCAAMTTTLNRWADGSRDGQLRGALALVRLDEWEHRGLAAAMDLLWSTRSKDRRDFDRLVEFARRRTVDSPSPPERRGCTCDGLPLATPGMLHSTAAGMDASQVSTAALTSGTAGGTDGLGSWRPKDLAAAVNGTKVRPTPSLGVARNDGVQFLYPGKEHACIGEMESGKSWFALACVAAELHAGRRVLYVHFEEDDETDTVERLLLLGVPGSRILAGLDFVGPASSITRGVIDHYAQVPPALVVLDGQNEAMALHGQGIREEDGAAAYRAHLVKPFTALGAAVLSLDHVVKDSEKNTGGYALGSVHKGNGLTGALILLENEEPFGIGRRGATRVYVTKDRPGQLRRHGQPTRVPRKFFVGVMSVDAEHDGAVVLNVWPPSNEPADEQRDGLPDEVLAVVIGLAEAPGDDVKGSDVTSRIARKRGDVLRALDELVAEGRLHRSTGPRNAHMYRVPTSSHDQHAD